MDRSGGGGMSPVAVSDPGKPTAKWTRSSLLPPPRRGAKLCAMPVKPKSRSGIAEDCPSLLVKVNGRRMALVGVQGRGGVSVSVGRWWKGPAARQKNQAAKREPTFDLRLDVTDANDPTWDRMYAWPTARVREGDRVEVRVVRGTPERGRFHGKYHRTRQEEVPFETNDTYAVIGTMAVWVDSRRVHLKERRTSRQAMSFTPSAARRVSKALIIAARRIQERTHK